MVPQSSPNVKITMMFPLLDNDAAPFDEGTWSWWRDEIVRVTPAYSELGLAQGRWEGHTDYCRWVMAVIPRDRLREVRRFLQEARLRFRQKEMYLDFHRVQLESVR
ncbi:MAG: hypothetical protein HY906_08050 [Deltaproteobacteria bacterium]|nr:hypothetical protein [Deltaproteobacteria bacterium]